MPVTPVDDRQTDYLALVRQGYDNCAADYCAARSGDREPALDWLLPLLAPESRALDIGCGGGVPVTRALCQCCREVVGVDLSPAQLAIARRQVPEARLLCGDFLELDIEGPFAAITCFYTLFHTRRDLHPSFLRKVKELLAPGGYFLFSAAREDEPSYTEPDFFGTTMYWSNYAAATYRELLEEMGFSVLRSEEVLWGAGERHPFLLARKDSDC